MSFFKNKKIDGQIYDVSHLDPFTFSLAVGADRFTIAVEFSCHCFTQKLDPTRHSPDLHYQHGIELRAFDIDRHGLSLMLPNKIRTFGNRTVYHTKHGSFFFLNDHRTPQGNIPYVGFFRAFRPKKQGIDVRLYIDSAYLKSGMTQWASPVKFTTLIAAIAKNRALKTGQPRQIKRR